MHSFLISNYCALKKKSLMFRPLAVSALKERPGYHHHSSVFRTHRAEGTPRLSPLQQQFWSMTLCVALSVHTRQLTFYKGQLLNCPEFRCIFISAKVHMQPRTMDGKNLMNISSKNKWKKRFVVKCGIMKTNVIQLFKNRRGSRKGV